MRTLTTSPWQLRVLGGAELVRDQQTLRLERKTAALLTFLAVEGQGAKYALAGILWPETTEASARANMRQLLRRLRVATSSELVEGEKTLRLTPSVEADVRALLQASNEQRSADVLNQRGELLAGVEFDDCEELGTWLSQARERLRSIRDRACAREVERLIQAADWRRARERAEQWTEIDPFAEEPWRQRIRVLHASGDRVAALAAYERLRDLLDRELGVEPDAETEKLIREIEQGRPASPAPTVAKLPVDVLHPPVLAGRDLEWRSLDEGWRAGQFLLITGDPGTGKSRLARDFARSKGDFIVFEGRPGDVSVPFASQTRALRKVLADHRHNGVPVPEWARRELTRLIPELLKPGEEPPPMTSAADKIRFYDAQGELLIRSTQGCECWVIDDIQYYDKGSIEVAEYLMSKHFPFGQPGGLPRFIDTFRRGELDEKTSQSVETMMAAGLVRLIEVGPLPHTEVARLLDGLQLPGAAALSREIAQYTGGNPLFVVETVKHLLETGGLERGWPGNFPPPGKVAALVRRRIERLSPLAVQLVQVAALAGSAFHSALAAQVLEAPLLDVARAQAEAEAALILSGNSFTHDLLFEGVRAAIPGPLEAALHQRLAVAMTQLQAPAIHVAHHWMAAAEPGRAAPLIVQAARVEEAALRFDEAAGHYAQAAEVFGRLGKKEEMARMHAAHERCRSVSATAQH